MLPGVNVMSLKGPAPVFNASLGSSRGHCPKIKADQLLRVTYKLLQFKTSKDKHYEYDLYFFEMTESLHGM